MGDLRSAPAAPSCASGPAHRRRVRGAASIWPSIYPRILAAGARPPHARSSSATPGARPSASPPGSTSCRGAEDASDRAGGRASWCKAHHGSLAREQRVVIEDQLKRGELRGIVATSSLELGIDMGAVDLVIQVESPGAVSRGLQRIGRAGHSVGEPSRGTIYPKHRGDLLEAAVVARRMIDGPDRVDPLPAQPARRARPADRRPRRHRHRRAGRPTLAALVRRCAELRRAERRAARTTCSTCSPGRYPSEEFSELRPRIVWDRVGGTLRARDGSKRLAVTSGGTIPDRGLFGVFLPDGTRVGELDEEMVYESRPGETFLLGASAPGGSRTSRFERVVVTPAPGEPGKMPFWHGDRPGRPLELGRALGAFQREMRALPADAARSRGSMDHYRLDAFAADNVLLVPRRAGRRPPASCPTTARSSSSASATRSATGGCASSRPFGTPVHAPWAMAIERRLIERYDMPVETMWGDDGIVLRLPEAADELPIDDARHRPRRHRRAGRRRAAADVAVLGPLP